MISNVGWILSHVDPWCDLDRIINGTNICGSGLVQSLDGPTLLKAVFVPGREEDAPVTGSLMTAVIRMMRKAQKLRLIAQVVET